MFWTPNLYHDLTERIYRSDSITCKFTGVFFHSDLAVRRWSRIAAVSLTSFRLSVTLSYTRVCVCMGHVRVRSLVNIFGRRPPFIVPDLVKTVWRTPFLLFLLPTSKYSFPSDLSSGRWTLLRPRRSHSEYYYNNINNNNNNNVTTIIHYKRIHITYESRRGEEESAVHRLQRLRTRARVPI